MPFESRVEAQQGLGLLARSTAQALGVSHAALIHYFDSREQVLIAMYEHAEAKRHAVPDAPDPSGPVDEFRSGLSSTPGPVTPAPVRAVCPNAGSP